MIHSRAAGFGAISPDHALHGQYCNQILRLCKRYSVMLVRVNTSVPGRGSPLSFHCGHLPAWSSAKTRPRRSWIVQSLRVLHPNAPATGCHQHPNSRMPHGNNVLPHSPGTPGSRQGDPATTTRAWNRGSGPRCRPDPPFSKSSSEHGKRRIPQRTANRASAGCVMLAAWQP
jgi:hypothetical protein